MPAQRSLYVAVDCACSRRFVTLPLTQADNLNAVITASGNQVQPYWGNLISSFVAGKDLDEFLLKPGKFGVCFCAACSVAANPHVVLSHFSL